LKEKVQAKGMPSRTIPTNLTTGEEDCSVIIKSEYNSPSTIVTTDSSDVSSEEQGDTFVDGKKYTK